MSETKENRKSFSSLITPVITTILISSVLAGATSLINLYSENKVIEERLRIHEKEIDKLTDKIERLEKDC